MLRFTLTFLLSLLLSAALFSAIPIANYFNLKRSERYVPEKQPIKLADPSLIKKKKPKPPPPKHTKPQSQNRVSKTVQLNRTKIAMALSTESAGEGGGVANYSTGISDGGAGNVSDPILLQPAPMPNYPEKAKKAGISGMVMCEITIDASGEVRDWKILDAPGDYGFRESIAAVLKKWKFQPAKLNGVPVEIKVKQPFQF